MAQPSIRINVTSTTQAYSFPWRDKACAQRLHFSWSDVAGRDRQVSGRWAVFQGNAVGWGIWQMLREQIQAVENFSFYNLPFGACAWFAVALQKATGWGSFISPRENLAQDSPCMLRPYSLIHQSQVMMGRFCSLLVPTPKLACPLPRRATASCDQSLPASLSPGLLQSLA